jgi:hypothetical protein
MIAAFESAYGDYCLRNGVRQMSALPAIEAASRRLLFDKSYKMNKIDAHLVNLVNPVKKISEFYSVFEELIAFSVFHLQNHQRPVIG